MDPAMDPATAPVPTPVPAPDALREVFHVRRLHTHPLRSHASRRDAALPGLVACTMPFVLAPDRPFVAIGCAEGIWVADARDPDALRRVLALRDVSEFAVIEEYGLLLVLAAKALYCASLAALDPGGPPHVPQRLAGAPVDFFRVGIWAHALVVVLKRRRMTDSVFHVLEPVLGPPPADPSAARAALDGGRTCDFRPLKEFYLPVGCTDLVFLRCTLAVLHPRGVEILDMDTLATAALPAPPPAAAGARARDLAKRCRASRPLGLFRGRDGTHLLCYTTFGVFVDRHGAPLDTLDWHGTALAVAPAAPYIVLFKARSAEVRHASTGRLAQVIFAPGLRCSWRGPGALQGGLDEDDLVPEAAARRTRMQLVMHAPHGLGPDELAQHVCDLVPNQ